MEDVLFGREGEHYNIEEQVLRYHKMHEDLLKGKIRLIVYITVNMIIGLNGMFKVFEFGN